ncbi:MAG: 3-dehydroquinate synthase [Gemmatimonadota bacterium]
MSSDEVLRVDVPPPELRPYEIRVRAGILDELPARAAAAAPAAAYAVVMPDDVAALYGERVRDALNQAGLRAELLVIPAGEAHKTRATWAAVTDRMLALRFGRDSAVIAIGGGVTGDVAGFVAATYMRGVPCVQVPTTLLAMIDASVGGKTGVDTDAGKNLVGAFHSPRLVLVDPLVLRTLPQAELRAGMAEAVKHGAIADEAYFAWITSHADSLLALEAESLEHLISRSVELKAGIAAEDPYERGRRAILNFGHTVGHALELQAGYAMPHGFAVAAGMVAEAALGEAAGVTEGGTRARIVDALQALGLPSASPVPADATALIAAMRLDKKARAAEPRFALLERIGQAAAAPAGGWTHTVAADVLERTLTQAAEGDPVV